jgi:hypothetical protein
MPSLHGFAGSIVWIFANPAGAKDPTVTYLKQATFQMIGHDVLLSPTFGTALPTISSATLWE